MAVALEGDTAGGGNAPPKQQRRPRASTRRVVLSWIAGFVAVVLIAEGGIRLVSNHLSDPVDYINLRTQAFVRDMDVLRDHHIRSDLTFAGNSLVQRDIDGAQFEAGLPGATWVNNVAVGGFEAPVLKRWLLEEVVPRLQPRRVVIGVSSSDFNAGRPDSTKSIVQYDDARATQPGFYGSLDRVLQISAISEYRNDLRDPYELIQDAQGRAVHMPTAGPLKSRATWTLGYPNVTPAQRARGQRTELNYICTQQLRDFRVGQDEMTAFSEMLQQLRAHGIQVVVVLMPVSSQYISCHPRGDADQTAWAAAVAAAGARQHVPVLDLSRSVPDSGFRDYEHLDVAPAKQFSTLLLSRLRELGW